MDFFCSDSILGNQEKNVWHGNVLQAVLFSCHFVEQIAAPSVHHNTDIVQLELNSINANNSTWTDGSDEWSSEAPAHWLNRRSYEK